MFQGVGRRIWQKSLLAFDGHAQKPQHEAAASDDARDCIGGQGGGPVTGDSVNLPIVGLEKRRCQGAERLEEKTGLQDSNCKVS